MRSEGALATKSSLAGVRYVVCDRGSENLVQALVGNGRRV
jgi:hypothetical protein